MMSVNEVVTEDRQEKKKDVIDLKHFIKELRRMVEVKTAMQAVGTEGIEVLIQDQVITKEEIEMLSFYTKSY